MSNQVVPMTRPASQLWEKAGLESLWHIPHSHPGAHLHTWLGAGLMLMRNVPGSLHKSWCWSGRSPREDWERERKPVLRNPSVSWWAQSRPGSVQFPVYDSWAGFSCSYKEPQWNLGRDLDLDKYLSDWRRAESSRALRYFSFSQAWGMTARVKTLNPSRTTPSHHGPSFVELALGDLTHIRTY